MPAQQYKLSEASLEWARLHIKKYGDTDIFPRPFELDCIDADWTRLSEHLQNVDIFQRNTRPSLLQMVPKASCGFRAAIQLDPLDAILYLALAYDAATSIEKFRPAVETMTACSYRIVLTGDGGLFSEDGGWTNYSTRSRQLADQSQYVLQIDIADFYNQISHHRINNVIEEAVGKSLLAAATENFLDQVTAKTSKGIPVGPTASIVLSEALLADIDRYLAGMGYPYCRYVDDIRIFVQSKAQAVDALHLVSRYLYTSHRLALQSSKTKIVKSADFIISELEEPESQEADLHRQSIDSLVKETYELSGYWIGDTVKTLDDLLPESKLQVLSDTVDSLFEYAISGSELRTAHAKYVLRRAKALRLRSIYPKLCNNLTLMSPLMRDVVLYLQATISEGNIQEVQSKIKNIWNIASMANCLTSNRGACGCSWDYQNATTTVK